MILPLLLLSKFYLSHYYFENYKFIVELKLKIQYHEETTQNMQNQTDSEKIVFLGFDQLRVELLK